jgi:hypothetical protein
LFEALGNGQFQFEKLGQQILLGGETVGGEDGGVQGGVGVFERVRAGQFEGAGVTDIEASGAAGLPRQRRRPNNGNKNTARATNWILSDFILDVASTR